MRLVKWLPRWWARGLRRLSVFVGVEIVKASDTELMWDGTGFAYRLQSWPELRPAHKTAAFYRALSVMTTRPVSVAWFSKHSGLPTDKAQRVMDWLVARGYAKEVVLARAGDSGLGEPA